MGAPSVTPQLFAEQPCRSPHSQISSSARWWGLAVQNPISQGTPSRKPEGLWYSGVPMVVQTLQRGPCHIRPRNGGLEDKEVQITAPTDSPGTAHTKIN